MVQATGVPPGVVVVVRVPLGEAGDVVAVEDEAVVASLLPGPYSLT